MKKIPLALLCIMSILRTFGQENIPGSDTLRKDALNFFMEASDFIKREIPFINYVRDIKDADIYFILTYQPTGSGGYEGTFYLVGQHAFEGMRDTVSYTTVPAETEDVLLRIKELETQYQYYTSFGFTYTSGSIYNNVVNPRFGDNW
jgi:hypothetical protein